MVTYWSCSTPYRSWKAALRLHKCNVKGASAGGPCSSQSLFSDIKIRFDSFAEVFLFFPGMLCYMFALPSIVPCWSFISILYCTIGRFCCECCARPALLSLKKSIFSLFKTSCVFVWRLCFSLADFWVAHIFVAFHMRAKHENIILSWADVMRLFIPVMTCLDPASLWLLV